jgi:hypothetical protein
MTPKVIESLKNRKKLPKIDLKQLKGGQKLKFFAKMFLVPRH